MERDTPAAVPVEKISHRFLTRVAVNTIDRARERLVSDSSRCVTRPNLDRPRKIPRDVFRLAVTMNRELERAHYFSYSECALNLKF